MGTTVVFLSHISLAMYSVHSRISAFIVMVIKTLSWFSAEEQDNLLKTI